MAYFVVRVREDNDSFDFKVFDARSSAKQYLQQLAIKLRECEIDEIAVFQVRTAIGVRHAKELVEAGALDVELMGRTQSPDYRTRIFVRDNPIDLSDILRQLEEEK